MDGLRDVSSGDVSPLLNSAPAINAVLEVARHRRKFLQGNAGAGLGSDAPLNPTVRVYVRNDTGDELEAFSVLALGAPLVSAVDYPLNVRDTPVFTGDAPASADDVFVVTLEPIGVDADGNGLIGRAAVLGVVPCDVVVNDPADLFATPAVGVTDTLDSTTAGPARIVWRESGSSGTKRAVVLLDRTGSGGAAATSWKNVVRLATTANGSLGSAYESGDTIDGVTLAVGDRILIKDQSSASDNGIYTVNASGAPTRATDADAGSELVGAVVYVSEGTANADTIWACTTNAPVTLGSTSLAWVKVYPSSGGSGVTGFFARLTTASSGIWKWVALTLNSSGVFVDDGSETASFNATPLTLDGTTNCNPVAGLRVWMLQSKQAGKYEFEPYGYADATHPGLVSTGTQTIAGNKTFHDAMTIDTGIVGAGSIAISGAISSHGDAALWPAGSVTYSLPTGVPSGVFGSALAPFTPTVPTSGFLELAATSVSRVFTKNASATSGAYNQLWVCPGGGAATGGLLILPGLYAAYNPATGFVHVGLTTTQTFKDSAGTTKTMTITGGIITDIS